MRHFNRGTKVLNDILDKCKPYGDKKDLSYIRKIETPTNEDIVFIKDKEKTLNQVTSCSTPSLCTHYKKSGHTQSRCHSRFLKI